MSISNNENINKYKNLPVWRTINTELCSLMCKNNVTWPGWKYKFTKPNIALISQINDIYFTLCVGCQSLHFYAQKCLKATTLLTRTQKQTNIKSSRTGSKYHANTVRTLSCLTESPRIHITSYNYILITLNNNKSRRQIWQLFDRRGVCASECKQRVSHAENAHVAITKLHTSTSTAAATYKLYAFIGLHS